MKKPKLPKGFKPPFRILLHSWNAPGPRYIVSGEELKATGPGVPEIYAEVILYALNLAYPVKKARKRK